MGPDPSEVAPLRWLAQQPGFERLADHVAGERMEIDKIIDTWHRFSTGQKILVRTALDFFNPRLLEDIGPLHVADLRSLDDHHFELFQTLCRLGTNRTP